jgi:hypothetical protein
MIFGPLIAVFLSTALLYQYLRWALIDPQNVTSQPSRLHALAIVITIALMLVRGLAVSTPSPVASMIFGLILAFALGPAIDPPEKLTKDEEPSALTRWMHKVRVEKSGRLLKNALLIIPLTWILHYFDVPTPWYFAAGFVALLFSVAKTAIVILTVENERARIRATLIEKREWSRAKISAINPLLHQSIILLSIRGSLSLAIWLALALPLVDQVPHLGVGHWMPIVGAILGFVLSGIL